MPKASKEKREGESTGPAKRCLVCGRFIWEQSADKTDRWCRECLDTSARFLVASFSQADKLGEAREALSDLLQKTQHPVWNCYLGLIDAENGNLDAGIKRLQDVLDSDGEYPQLSETLSSLLATRARIHLKGNNYRATADDLALAIEIQPQDQDLNRSLSLANIVDVCRHSDKEMGQEELAKVVRTWQHMQIQQPHNCSIAHNLAILSYRLASEAEEEAKKDVADSAWLDVIANWSLILHADSFWQEWAERENSLYQFNISKEDIDGVRQVLQERLLNDFRTYRTRYYENGDQAAATRHREYEISLLQEMKTAKALKEIVDILQQQGLPVLVSTPCGPLMLKSLNLHQLIAEMLDKARHSLPEDKIAELETYLSPRGRIEVLLESHWLEPAESELDELLKQEPDQSALIDLMVRVLVELGERLAKVGDWDAAMQKLEKGLGFASSNNDLKKSMVAVCLDEAKKLAEGEEEKGLDEAINVLERGLKSLPEDREIREHLATRHAERGLKRNNKKNYASAVKDMERALGLDKNNGLALRGIHIILMNRAIDLANSSKLDEAINIAEKAFEYNQAADIRKNLSDLHIARGLMRMKMRSDRYGCIADFKQALKYNPDNQEAREGLLTLLKM